MANVIPFSLRGALFSAQHDLASGGNTFKFALYTSSAYDTSSTIYVVTNEVGTSGTNYSTGGNTLSSQAVASGTAVASCDFADTEWTSATITAAYGAIYNSTSVDGLANRLVVVLDFSGSKTCTNGTFKITFPDPTTPANAILSMA
jgi:hypothetical protein|tara:strand:- start:35 stop:472 length:438 start_codon:yes stop_codon:yes gene_type:complete